MSTSTPKFSIPRGFLGGVHIDIPNYLEVKEVHGAAKIWHPWELIVDKAGLDGRNELWRYITADTSSFNTQLFPFEGLNDLNVFVNIGPTEAVQTLTCILQTGMIGSQDGANHLDTSVITSTPSNVVNTSTSVNTTFRINFSDIFNGNNKERRGDIPLYWRLRFTPNAAGIPVCAHVTGR